MYLTSFKSPAALLLAATCLSLPACLSAQAANPRDNITVTGVQPATEVQPTAMGPEVKGIISARSGNRIQVTAADGTSSTITIMAATQIRGNSGLFSSGQTPLSVKDLLNGLPVTVRTRQSDAGPGNLAPVGSAFTGAT